MGVEGERESERIGSQGNISERIEKGNAYVLDFLLSSFSLITKCDEYGFFITIIYIFLFLFASYI